MRRSVGLLIITFIVCTGCAPIGDIGGGGAANNELIAVPYRIVYNLNQLFIRDTDLGVFVSNYGILELVPNKKVTIEIEQVRTGETNIIDVDENWPLEAAGRYAITVSYPKYKSVTYNIEVQDPLGIGPPQEPDGNIIVGEQDNSTVTWKYPGKK